VQAQITYHYSPLTLAPAGTLPPEGAGRVGLLAFRAVEGDLPYIEVEVLSPTGDLGEAADSSSRSLTRIMLPGNH